jgi:hypothetical protein
MVYILNQIRQNPLFWQVFSQNQAFSGLRAGLEDESGFSFMLNLRPDCYVKQHPVMVHVVELSQ